MIGQDLPGSLSSGPCFSTDLRLLSSAVPYSWRLGVPRILGSYAISQACSWGDWHAGGCGER